MTSLLPAFIGHSVGEFVLISKELRKRKERLHYPAYAIHGSVVALCLLIAFAWQTGDLQRAFWAGVLGGSAHVLIEFVVYVIGAILSQSESRLNSWLGRVDRGFYLVSLFVAEQACHVLMITQITNWVWAEHHPLNSWLHYGQQLIAGTLAISLASKATYITLVALVGTFGAAELLRIALSNSFNPANARNPKSPVMAPSLGSSLALFEAKRQAASLILADEADRVPAVEAARALRVALKVGWWKLAVLITGVQNQALASGASEEELPLGTGRWIGITERLMMMMMVALNAWPAVGFIVAAKSMARFKELDTREKAEYYIVGTLMSSIIGVVGGMLVTRVTFQ